MQGDERRVRGCKMGRPINREKLDRIVRHDARAKADGRMEAGAEAFDVLAQIANDISLAHYLLAQDGDLTDAELIRDAREGLRKAVRHIREHQQRVEEEARKGAA